MLTDGTVTANMPAADLDRARAFYSEKLGLEPTSEPGGEVLLYRTQGGSGFSVYRTDHAGTAGHTLAQWHVADIEQEVRELRATGVDFETYDLPGDHWEDCTCESIRRRRPPDAGGPHHTCGGSCGSKGSSET